MLVIRHLKLRYASTTLRKFVRPIIFLKNKSISDIIFFSFNYSLSFLFKNKMSSINIYNLCLILQIIKKITNCFSATNPFDQVQIQETKLHPLIACKTCFSDMIVKLVGKKLTRRIRGFRFSLVKRIGRLREDNKIKSSMKNNVVRFHIFNTANLIN